jgi:PAS domain S-box-containing protein
MQSVDAGVWVLDEHGKTVMVNQAAERMTGWAAADLIGKISHTIIHHTRADGSPYPILECPIYQSVFHARPARVEGEVFWRRDGTSFPIIYTTTPVVGERGESLGAVQIFHEATDP